MQMKIPQEVKVKLSSWFTEEEMAGVEIHICSWLPRLGIAGITFGSTIFINSLDLSPKGITLFKSEHIALIGHELVHVQQYRELGKFWFLVMYLLDYADGKRLSEIWLEEPAYAMQEAIVKTLGVVP